MELLPTRDCEAGYSPGANQSMGLFFNYSGHGFCTIVFICLSVCLELVV